MTHDQPRRVPDELPPDDTRDDWDDLIAPAAVDSVDLVVEAEVMMSVFAAQRFERIDGMRREAQRDAQRHGYQLTEIIERSLRLELAAALKTTEAAAGRLIAQADARVNRYPAALASLSGARMTERHAVDLAQAMDTAEPEFRETLLASAIAIAIAPLGTFRRKLRALIESVRSVTLTERRGL